MKWLSTALGETQSASLSRMPCKKRITTSGSLKAASSAGRISRNRLRKRHAGETGNTIFPALSCRSTFEVHHLYWRVTSTGCKIALRSTAPKSCFSVRIMCSVCSHPFTSIVPMARWGSGCISSRVIFSCSSRI